MATTLLSESSLSATPFLSIWVTLSLFACSGPDNLTDPVVSAGGTTGNTTAGTNSGGQSSTVALGGTGGTGTVTTGTLTNAGAAAFDWGTTTYDATQGANVAYQGHYNGVACSAACHSHSFNVGGTLYLSDGTTAAANAQVGVLADGTLTTGYSGSGGNFYFSKANVANWATVQIAVRTLTGTLVMPVNASATGNCNNCHSATNRITVP